MKDNIDKLANMAYGMNTGGCCNGGSVEVRATGDISDRFQPMIGEYQPTGEYSLLEDEDGPGTLQLRQDPDAQANWVEAPKYRNIHGVRLELEYEFEQFWQLWIDLGRFALSWDKSVCPGDATDWRIHGPKFDFEYSANITISCK